MIIVQNGTDLRDPRVLVTGAAGFVGGATARALVRGTNCRVRALVHDRTPDSTACEAIELVPGDLTAPNSIRGLCRGVDAVVHTASYVGRDEQHAWTINRDGTDAVVSEALREGVPRFLYVSTAAVHGPGPHRNISEDELAAAPVSAVSRARLAAETLVRAAGGVVLRPHLIYGTGDQWFIPALVGLTQRLGGLVDGGRARLSIVAVDDLAAVLAVLSCITSAKLKPGTVWHVNHPEPVPISAIVATLAEHLNLPVPTQTVSLPEVPDRSQKLGVTEHQLALISQDHYYASDRIWQLTGLAPASLQNLDRYAAWYRQLLRPSSADSALPDEHERSFGS